MCFKFVILLALFSYLNNSFALSPRYAAIVIEASSGRVLDEHSADKIRHPASLTKMMTLYMVFEALKKGRLQMGTRIPVSAHAARQIPTKLGLRVGESVTVETIIKGMVVKSANDASAAIAEYLGGSEANFAAMMTKKARALGMSKTIFKNASGVPNSQQITTARDMATLSRALYQDFPRDYKHFRIKAFHHRGNYHSNHNHLLGTRKGRDFEVDGIKTGYVAASGFNLAASAVRRGPDHKPKRLIAVVLGGPNRHWRDQRVVDLLETNFEKVGLGRGKSVQEIDEDDENAEEDENVVKAFLNEETNSPKKPIKPIQVNWPPRPLNQKSWGVQLGTFASLKEAQATAFKTLSNLKSGAVSTPKVKKGRKLLYGARLIGISKTDAQSVCRRYAQNGKECRLLTEN